MRWSDDALLLGVGESGGQELLLEVLTALHGRCHCRLPLSEPDMPTLLPGATLHLSGELHELAAGGTVVLHRSEGGIAPDGEDDAAARVLDAARVLLGRLLPLGDPARSLHGATRTLFAGLSCHDGRWPAEYARWELALLSHLGPATGLARCRPAFRHGETVHFSPRSGRFLTRAEAAPFLDEMLPVPGFLMGGDVAELPDVRDALALTGCLLVRAGLHGTGGGAHSPERQKVLQAVAGVRRLPAARPATPEPDVEAIRRRLLALRPLLVHDRRETA